MNQNSNNNIFKKLDNYIFQLKNRYTLNINLVIILFLITFFSIIPYMPHKYDYKLGDIAKSDIKANKDIKIYDKEATNEKIKRLKNSSLPVYDFDTEKLDNLKEQISLFFEKCREMLPFNKNNRVLLKTELESIFHYKISNREFKLLERKKFSENIEWILIKLVSHYMEKGITDNNAKLDVYKDKGITIRLVPSNEEIKKKDIYTFYKLNEAKRLIKKNYIVITGHSTRPYILRKLLSNLAVNIIQPNLLYNKKETDKRVKEVEKNIKPVYYILKKNEIIVREGNKIDAQTLTKINATQREKNFTTILKKTFSIFVLLLLIAFIVYQLFAEDLKHHFINARDALLFCIIITFSAVVFRGLFVVSSGLIESFNKLSPYFFYFMIPFAFPTLIIKITINEKYAFASSILIAYFFYI